MSGDTLVLSRSYLSGGPLDDPNEPQDPDLPRTPERAACLKRTLDGSIVLVNNDSLNPAYIADMDDLAELSAQSRTSYYAVQSHAKVRLAPSDSNRHTLSPGQMYFIAVGPPPPRLEEDPHYVVAVSLPIDAPDDVPIDAIPTNMTTGLEPSTEVQRLNAVQLYLAQNRTYRLALAYEAYQFILDLPGAARVGDGLVKSHTGTKISDARAAVNDLLYPPAQYGKTSVLRLQPDALTKLLVTHALLTKRDVRLASDERQRRHARQPPLIAD